VLIPRPETEIVVERALRVVDELSARTAVDLGTGSGVIAMSLACERVALSVWATDASPDALAVTTANRFPLSPEIPTIAEAGYPGFEALAWNGVLVASATPGAIVQRLNTEINAILKDPEVKSKLNA
jgi:tripartite-type tricarboxylate transporter receptor subunit TctC